MSDRTDGHEQIIMHDIGGWISGPSLDQPLNQPPSMSPEDGTALWVLRCTWGTYYGISYSGDEWRASRVGSGGMHTLTADDPRELGHYIWSDFITWQTESKAHQ